MLERLEPLAGVAVDARVAVRQDAASTRRMLFTHRGLSGPAILQISSYWREGDEIAHRHAAGPDVADVAAARARRDMAGRRVQTVLAQHAAEAPGADRSPSDAGIDGTSGRPVRQAAALARRRACNDWRVKPAGSEGYRTAEVTLGGVDTDGARLARRWQAKAVPGLYFIGEAVDVTGWLGGYNFQWAWSSGWAAGQAAEARKAGVLRRPGRVTPARLRG